MKKLVAGIIVASLTGCVSSYQPAQPAQVMWEPTKQAKTDVRTTLKQCDFIDYMSAGVQKIHEQAQCMRDMGFEPNLSSYNSYNCYGNAPAGCIVYWPQGMAKPQSVKAKTTP